MRGPVFICALLASLSFGPAGVASPDHLLGYGTSAQVTQGLIDQVVAVMKERLPGPDRLGHLSRDGRAPRAPR